METTDSWVQEGLKVLLLEQLLKGIIQGIEFAVPEVGLVYAGFNILTGLLTGETITDRIGDAVDNTFSIPKL